MALELGPLVVPVAARQVASFDFPRLKADGGALSISLRRYRKALGHAIQLIDWDPFERPLPSLRNMSGERISYARSDNAAGAALDAPAVP
jgi:hypothetical protein